MLFTVTCLDKPGQSALRIETRAEHVAFLKSHAEAVKIAGPLLADDGKGMIGSLLVIEAADRDALDAMIAADPYARVGLFDSVVVRPWLWTIGNPG